MRGLSVLIEKSSFRRRIVEVVEVVCKREIGTVGSLERKIRKSSNAGSHPRLGRRDWHGMPGVRAVVARAQEC